MPQSLSKVYIHIIFSVKNREPLIQENHRAKLQAYIVAIIAKLSSCAESIFALPDHVHILCTLPRTISIAELISKIKSSSSEYMKNEDVKGFSWQNRYGIFSVSSSKIEIVKNYIIKQKKHHKQSSFKEKYAKFLHEYNVDYNENYVWD
jgi:putative transposase